LKAALQLPHPHETREAKSIATQVLEKYGGYKGLDDEDVDFGELTAEYAGNANVNDEADGAGTILLLFDEVRMISGSVYGDDFANQTGAMPLKTACWSQYRMLCCRAFYQKQIIPSSK